MKCASQKHPQSCYDLGEIFEKQGKIKEAIMYYRKAADDIEQAKKKVQSLERKNSASKLRVIKR